MKKVFLGMPVYGGYDPSFVSSLMHLLGKRPCPMVVRPCVGDSLVARARNRLAAQFLASDCTHLLFLDTDLIFSPDHIARLVSHDEPIVAGLYPKKQTDLAWVCNLDEGSETDDRGLHPARYAGTGCLLIAREVFEKIRELHPEIEYDPDEGDTGEVKWDFFATGVRLFEGSAGTPARRRYLSEDWMFCQRALDLGSDIWMDTGVILRHVGECVYPLQEIESFADPVSAPLL